nr:hypothetical protein [Tanacetum cinerariifolium]
GCAVANESLRTLQQLDANGAWEVFREEWKSSSPSSPTDVDGNGSRTCFPPSSTDVDGKEPQTWSMWSPSFLHATSHLPCID